MKKHYTDINWSLFDFFEDDENYYGEYDMIRWQNFNKDFDWETYRKEQEEKWKKYNKPEKYILIERFKNDNTGYTFLRDLCKKVRNKYSSYSYNKEPITERVKYINYILDKLNVPYKNKLFNSSNLKENNNPDQCNVNIFIKSTNPNNKDLIIFTAHHDISNTNSENCQDNSASICNLIHLAYIINNKKQRNKNCLLILTDGEECGGKGVKFLDTQLKSEYKNYTINGILSLELTALGKTLWIEKSYKVKNSKLFNTIEKIIKEQYNQYNDYKIYSTPYNEAVTLRSLNYDAICIGILPDSDINIMDGNGYAKNWSLCHSDKDTFEKSANKKDMISFVTFLTKFIN